MKNDLIKTPDCARSAKSDILEEKVDIADGAPCAETTAADITAADRDVQKESAQTEEQSAPTLRQKILHLGRDALILTISAFLLAFGIFVFMRPNNFSTGGVSGIALMLYKLTNGWFKTSYSMFVFNLPLVILTYFFVNKRFAFATTFATVMQSLWLFLFEHIPMIEIEFPDNMRIFAPIAAGIFLGASLAVALIAGGSTGGTDCIAMILQRKYQATNIGWFILGIDAIIVTASAFVFTMPEGTNCSPIAYGFTTVMLSLTERFVAAKVNEFVSNGQLNAIKFEIITEKPDELAAEIFNRLHRGVTELHATGMYTGKSKNLLCVVIRKRQLSTFRKLLREVDPNAFAYMMTASEVLGKGFVQAK